MKNKKGLFLVFLSVLLILNCSMGYAITFDEQEILSNVNKNIETLEEYFESNGTSVIKELEKDKIRIEKLLENENDPVTIEKMKDQINGYDRLIDSYEFYSREDLSKIYNEDSFDLYGVSHPVLSPAVASIVAYFTMNKYYLAAELLNHALYATKNSTYEPYQGNRVKYTNEFGRLRQEIVSSGRQSGQGSSSFPNKGSIEDRDLYYALHLYRYDYTKYNGRYSLFIKDVYDFAVSSDANRYDRIAGTAINTMFMAQSMGVINPYNVLIEITF